MFYKKLTLFYLIAVTFLPIHLAYAEILTINVTIKDHVFNPAEIVIPANQKVKLFITNEDSSAEEFESLELNREKVILGKSSTVIFIGPLSEGQYPFFGEFNPKTAQGMVIVK